MRIISQNRHVSLEFRDCDIIVNGENVMAGEVLIGTYDSEERALEVFIDIHNTYSPINIVMKDANNSKEIIEYFLTSIKNAPVSSIQCDDSDIKFYDNIVYFMPET